MRLNEQVLLACQYLGVANCYLYRVSARKDQLSSRVENQAIALVASRRHICHDATLQGTAGKPAAPDAIPKFEARDPNQAQNTELECPTRYRSLRGCRNCQNLVFWSFHLGESILFRISQFVLLVLRFQSTTFAKIYLTPSEDRPWHLSL